MRKVFLSSTKRDNVITTEIPDSLLTFKSLIDHIKQNLPEYALDVNSGKLAYFLDKRDGSMPVRMTLDTTLPPEINFLITEVVNKSSAGAELSRSELGAKIKEVSVDPAVKSRFIIDGKNWTQLPTSKLQELWAQYEKDTQGKSAPKTTESKPAKVTVYKETPKPKEVVSTPKVEIITGKMALDIKNEGITNILLAGHDLKKS